MRRGLACALLATAVAAACAGCAVSDGPQTTRTRRLAPFTRIDNATSVNVRLHIGGPQRVRVSAGRKAIGEVGTEVRDGELHLTYDHHSEGMIDHEVTVDASVPRLTAVDASGSGDLEADGVQASAFEIDSSGSGHITVRGSANRLAVAVRGSGDADLAGLRARRARVTVSGSGGVDVNATTRLAVGIDGSGDVHYRGHPAIVSKRIDGSGDLSRVG